MQIGQVIRQYRKSKHMTQEEMANYLGVSAPAVNKWENDNSLPDITLLAPIARLLGISLDVLLDFQEELTQEEIQNIVYRVNAMLREQPYEEAFVWAKEKLEQYPNNEILTLELAVLLYAEGMKHRTAERSDYGECGHLYRDKYEEQIVKWLTRGLESGQEQIRTMAADSLFSFYLNWGQYDKAEEYLTYFSEQNPERKRKQAVIYQSTGRRQEAYKTYEELLFSVYQMANILFHSVFALALEDQNMEKARSLAEKQSMLAEIFEMGEYRRLVDRLELAMAQKDVDVTIDLMQRMLGSFAEISQFTKSSLYEHMDFREPREEFMVQLREDLLKAFREEGKCDFLKGDGRWEELVRF